MKSPTRFSRLKQMLVLPQLDTVGEPSSARGLDSVWYAQTKEIARLVLSERGEEDVTQT